MADNTGLLTLLILLTSALLVCIVMLIRRGAGKPREAEPALALMQQQITTLGDQVGRLASLVPKEIGAALGQLVEQLGARLSENAQTVQKVGADTGRVFAEISHRLGELGKSSEQILELGQDIRGLNKIFQAPKYRGGLGELSLGALLQETFPAEQFSLQHEFSSGDKVDAVLRLPGGLVPIDSKFPLASFRARIEATTDEQRGKALRAFARDVRKHIDDIADKYIRPGDGTLDFALMYVPAESVFYEVIVREDRGPGEEAINTYALDRRVIPVSPNSLHAYLQAIAYGLMGLKIEQRALDILKELQQLYADFGLFRDSFELGQKHLRNAQAAFADASDRVGQLSYRIEQFVRVADESSKKSAAPRH